MQLSPIKIQNISLSKTKSIFAIILSGLLYGGLGYFGTHLINEDHFSITNMLFWRFFISAIAMFIWTWKSWPGSKSLSQTKINSISFPKNLFINPFFVVLFILGFVFYAGSSSLYFVASARIGTGLAMVIFFSYPVFVMALTWFFERKRISIFAILAFSGILAGLTLLGQNQENHFNWPGVLLSVLSAIFYAVYVYWSKRLVSEADPKHSTFIVSLSCCIAFFLISYFNDTLVCPQTLRAVVDVVSLGVICTALPILLLLEGMKKIDATRASIFSVCEPIATLFIGYLFLNEVISTTQIVGVFVIIAGAIMVQLEKEPSIA